jgi:glycogen operon protein
MVSTGVPMITMGDELGRTQFGNNNAYCQDNEISWVDWNLEPWQEQLLASAQHLGAVRHQLRALRQRFFFEGKALDGGNGEKDLAWFASDGTEVPAAVWNSVESRTVGMYMSGGLRARSERGDRIVTSSVFTVLHAGAYPVQFTMPAAPYGPAFQIVADTSSADGRPSPNARLIPNAATVTIPPRCVQVYEAVPLPRLERRRVPRN